MNEKNAMRIEVVREEPCPHCLQMFHREEAYFCVFCDDLVCACCVRLKEDQAIY